MRLNRHIRSDRAKWTVTGFLFVVILAALVLGGLQLWGADSAKPGNWFSPKQEQEPSIETASAIKLASADIQGTYFSNVDFTVYVGTAQQHIELGHVMGSGSMNSNGDVNSINFDVTTYYLAGYRQFSIRINVAYFTGNAVPQPSASDPQVCYLGSSISGVGSVSEWDVCAIYLTPIEVALPQAPAREGYTFVGWYTDEALTIPYTGSTVTSDITLYPKYEVKTYTVTYVGGVGGVFDSVTVTYNETVTLPDATATGYDFLGWYTVNDVQWSDALPITADLTLYAKFELKTFTVKLMTADGSIYKELSVTYGTKLVVVLEEAELTDYSIQKVVNSKGKSISTNVVEEDVKVVVGEKTDEEKAKSWIVTNWVWLVVGAAVLVVLITLFSSRRRR